MQSALIEIRDVHLRYPLQPLLRRSIKEAALRWFERKPAEEVYIEALQGLNFSVSHGERLGIIGGNGAGKSTMLRVIAGIYPISAGSLTVRGTARALFDLGVGFDVEDTGRENIFHRGLLLGYSKEQLRELEHDIVAFSGLESFIDMPLKTYSAGMQVRLAFSISTALSSDILLVDEVIGAGDADFQMRARDRISTLIERAGCVVFVSHDLVSIRDLCDRVLWLEAGKIKADGPSSEVVHEYERSVNGISTITRGVTQSASFCIAPNDIGDLNERLTGSSAAAVHDATLASKAGGFSTDGTEGSGCNTDAASIGTLSEFADFGDCSEAAVAGPRCADAESRRRSTVFNPLRLIDMLRTQPYYIGATCIHSSEGVEIHTPRQAWSYSAEAPLYIADDVGDLEFIVAVSVKVQAGVVGIGILDKGYSQFIAEEFCAAPELRLLTFRLTSSQSPAMLIVRNGDGNGTASRAVITDLSLFVKLA